MRRIAAAFLLAIAAQAGAETGPSEAAQAAAARLQAAAVALEEAATARDRVAALTTTVQAYEDGLSALRDGLRRAAIRERTVTRDLDARSDEVARLLGVLQVMGRAPAPVLLLHPSGPTGTARSGMILADVTPALQVEVDSLRASLEEMMVLRALQEEALETLESGLSGAQTARADLAAAIADRTDLPRRFTEDPVHTALLLASTETLEAFASVLVETEAEEGAMAAPDATLLKGELILPVEGQVLRRFREADAAGIERPGIIIATRPRALVITPTAATVRYNGPLLEYGTVVILEPAPDVLWIFSGLAEAFGQPGQVLPPGSPIGLMGGETPAAQVFLTDSQSGGGTSRTETLYLEAREGQEAVDPALWFAFE